MKIIYSGIQHENYNPDRGFSFEYNNFYLALKNMPGVEVIEYPFDPIIKIGKKKFNQGLLELIRKKKPDLLFVFMYTDELDKKILLEIKKLTISLAWFSDDSWRFYNYSRHYAFYFSWVITTYSWIPKFFEKYGYKNVIRSQWGCNSDVWKPILIKRDIDVSFVGQYNSSRGRIISELRSAGINVFVRGWGWPEGRVSQEEMIKIFSRSKINLNINIPPDLRRLKLLARLFLKRSAGKIVPDFLRLIDNFKSWRAMAIPQVKARSFELAACRTFVISGYGDDLENFYKENEEMVFYRSTADLIEKIKYYLPRDEERERIARAGYERTLREHTYQKRFETIFHKVYKI